MSITVKNINELEYYTGPHAIPRIRFRSARAPLGISAFGMNVLELDAGCEGYPEHNHADDGQEELYLVLEGSLLLLVDGQERVLKKGDMVRVPPETTRKFTTRNEGATLLAIGATPGKPYTPDPRMAR